MTDQAAEADPAVANDMPAPTGSHPVDVDTRRRIGRAWREIRRGAAAHRIKDLFYGMGPDGLDMAIADALVVLVQNGPMRMGEMAEALHITPATATRAVDCLVEKGLAERVKAVDDLRSILVSPTELGHERHEIIAARIGSGLDQMLGEFDPNEQVQLAEMLERFVASVDRWVVSQDTATDDAD